MLSPDEIEHLIKTGIHAAHLASLKILEVDRSALRIKSKTDDSPVTHADMLANKQLIEILTPTGIPIISEEEHVPAFQERIEWPVYWLIDPLDGTKEYIRGRNEYTVNVALMIASKPVGGIISVPEKGTLYATINSTPVRFQFDGTTLSNETVLPVQSFDKRENDLVRIAASRSHLSPKTTAYIAEHYPDQKVDIIYAGSAYKFCVMLDHKADIYPRFAPCMEWDTAAGHALLKAAGKNIYQAENGNELLYNKKSLYNPPFIAR